MIQLEGLEERGKFPQQADKRLLANLEHKIKHLTTTVLAGFLINKLSKVCVD